MLALDENGVTKYHLSDVAAWSSADLSNFEDNFAVKTFQGDDFLIDKKGNGELEIKDGIKETADFKETDILTLAPVWNRHAIEQMQLRGRRRVDGVGHLEFDFHTGTNSPASSTASRRRAAS